MQINWKVKHEEKNSLSYIIYSDPRRLAESIRRCGKAVFIVEHNTKTTLRIQIFSGENDCLDSFLVAHIPKGAEDLKYHTTTSHSYFHGMQTHSHLKLTKTQRLPELKRYIGAVLEQLLPQTAELDTDLIIHDVPELS